MTTPPTTVALLIIVLVHLNRCCCHHHRHHLHLTAVMVVDVVGFVANLLLNDKYDAVLRALRWTPQTQMQRTKVSLRFLYLILPKNQK